MNNETRSVRHAECESQEEITRNTNRNQSISKGQEEFNHPTDNREVENTKDSNGTLLQNGQEQGNTESRGMGETKRDIKSGQSLRQASVRILREGDGVRDDKESLQHREDKPNTRNIRYFSMFTGVGGFELGFKRANAISKTTWNESRRDEGDSRSTEQVGLAPKQSISSKPFPHVEQDWEGWNSPINEWGDLLRSRSIPSFSCVGMSEFNKYSSQVLRYRFPNIKNWGDCTKIKPEDLPDFDLLCGGFPCQAFSIAGKRRGFEDIRGTMFFEVARILKVKRPKIIFLENVKGLLNHNKGETFRVIIQTLDELGYEVQWMVLNSKFHGVPQNRERVLIIGNLRGECRSKILPFREVNKKNNELCGHETVTNTVHARITADSNGIYMESRRSPQIKVEGMLTEDGWDKRNESTRRVYSTSGISPTVPTGQGGGVMPKIRAVLTPDRPEKRQQGRRFKEPGEPAFTVTGQDIHGIATDSKIRRLTPTECERLQGFPDGWTQRGINEEGELVNMSDTQRYKQMGNAVTTNVIAAVGSQILNNTKVEE